MNRYFSFLFLRLAVKSYLKDRNKTGDEQDIITAVVLSEVSIAGGTGKITGVIFGVLLMGVLTNGMILMNVDEYTQWNIKGLVFLGAIPLMNSQTERKHNINY